MKVSEYLVKKIKEYGVTDVFGIPGAVILDFIYKTNEAENIEVHLNYHEQASAYAACGYAQASGKLGVAYSTKGPGFTNMFTAIAEAYYDSLPVLFITAHSQKKLNPVMRIEEEQEINHVEFVKNITKCALRIDDVQNVVWAIDKACTEALEGRKGPVLLDFSSKVLKAEMSPLQATDPMKKDIEEQELLECISCVKACLGKSKRPVFLIGDGFRGTGMEIKMQELSSQMGIPVLSSRFSQDIGSKSGMYYGYIGSHGLRYSNFILSKTDCILALGNRMAFQIESMSFRPIVETAQVIRVDVDRNEFVRDIPNSLSFCVNLKDFIPAMLKENITYDGQEAWIKTCNVLREELKNSDVTYGAAQLQEILQSFSQTGTIVCDIGNNELLASRAYALAGEGRTLLHSKVFKTVGSALGKAIGAYYAEKTPVLCIVGDQGFQFNIQELQYLVSHRLPITIVICNNHASGMLKNSERQQGYGYALHTTPDSGYSHPDFKNIANAYGIKYTALPDKEWNKIMDELEIIELFVDETNEIMQHLPKGNPCQKFVPELDMSQYDYFDNL